MGGLPVFHQAFFRFPLSFLELEESGCSKTQAQPGECFDLLIVKVFDVSTTNTVCGWSYLPEVSYSEVDDLYLYVQFTY